MEKHAIFVSSSIRGLVDLRAVLYERIKKKHFQPFLSEYPEFEPEPDIPSYAACLINVRKSLRVIAVIDQWYGVPQYDWGPEYSLICKGLSPFHGEIAYALHTSPSSKLWVYVRDSVQKIYDIWIKDPISNSKTFENELDINVLYLLKDLYKNESKLWIRPFVNVMDLSKLIENRLYNLRNKTIEDSSNLSPKISFNFINNAISSNLNQVFPYQVINTSPNLINAIYGDGTEIDVYSGGTVIVQKQGSTDSVTHALAFLEGSAPIEGSSSLNVTGEVQEAKND